MRNHDSKLARKPNANKEGDIDVLRLLLGDTRQCTMCFQGNLETDQCSSVDQQIKYFQKCHGLFYCLVGRIKGHKWTFRINSLLLNYKRQKSIQSQVVSNSKVIFVL